MPTCTVSTLLNNAIQYKSANKELFINLQETYEVFLQHSGQLLNLQRDTCTVDTEKRLYNTCTSLESTYSKSFIQQRMTQLKDGRWTTTVPVEVPPNIPPVAEGLKILPVVCAGFCPNKLDPVLAGVPNMDPKTTFKSIAPSVMSYCT